MATHSSVLAWRIPGTGEPGGLPSMGSHGVGHDWSDLAAAAAAAHVVTDSVCCSHGYSPSPEHCPFSPGSLTQSPRLVSLLPTWPTLLQCPQSHINDFLQYKCYQALLCLKHIDHFHGLSEKHANSPVWPPKVCMEGCGLSLPESECHLLLTTKLSCPGSFIIFILWLMSPFLCLIVFSL